jgi:hypothetical protein
MEKELATTQKISGKVEVRLSGEICIDGRRLESIFRKYIGHDCNIEIDLILNDFTFAS